MNIYGCKSAVIQAGGKTARVQGKICEESRTSLSCNVIDEDFASDPSWDTQVSGSSTVTQNTGEVVSTIIGGGECRVDAPNWLFETPTEVWADFDFIVDSLTIGTNDHAFDFFTLNDSVAEIMRIAVINDAGTLKFRSIYRPDTGTVTNILESPVFNIGQNYIIRMHFKQNSGVDQTDGIYEMWIGTEKILNIQDADNDTRQMDNLYAGAIFVASSIDGVIKIDNICVSTTGEAP